MAATPSVLPRAPEPAGRNARALFDEGLEALRCLSGEVWTDHNVHDPGITLLEVATWALAELGYRADLPLADLLAPAPGSGVMPEDRFFRALASLTNRPLTALDWRKRFIDLPGVKNAWIARAEAPPLYVDLLARELVRIPPAHGRWREVRLRGLFRVRVDFMDGVATAAERERVLRAVREAFETDRNLCEELVAVEAVPTERFALCAEVDLEAAADVAEAAARLLFEAERTLAPQPASRALAESLSGGSPRAPRGADEVFDGPKLENGFLDGADLAACDLPSELRLSDLINALMDVPGVRALPDLLLNPLDGSGAAVPVANRWRVPVTEGHLPRLALGGDGSAPAGRLVFRKRGLPVAGWNLSEMPAAVRARLTALQEEARRAVETPANEDLPVPSGRWRDVAAYRPLRLDLPAVYGVGEAGLPGGADARRRVQALQLAAYLTFFDQRLADDAAQLARGAELLSVRPEDLAAVKARFRGPPGNARTLAAQAVAAADGPAPIYRLDDADGAAPETQLARLEQSDAEAVDHQQRLLDHLLARAGEDFSEYAAALASAFGRVDRDVIADKCDFLAEAPALAANRAGAYRQDPEDPADLWNTPNVSGLERRLGRLLGIADLTRRNLGAVSYDTYAEVDATPGDEFRFRVLRAGDGKILLSSTRNYTSREEARARMIEAIARGQRDEEGHYRVLRGRDGRFYFRVTAEDGRLLARRVEGFATEAAAREEVAETAAYLRDHYSGEGLYVLENLLLRPREAEDPLLPVCVGVECPTCPGADPYSWRLQIVLPAYAGRFQDLGFRNFAEHVIRSEVPAHLLPKVCWVDADDMARFERAYRDWLPIRAGHARPSPSERRARLQALVDALTSMKNQYPQRALVECPLEAGKPPFVLGTTALGSSPDLNPGYDDQETDHG